MTPEQFIYLFGLATNDERESADVAVHVEGDGLSRIKVPAAQYHAGLAPKILVTGEVFRNPRASRTDKVAADLVSAGVPREHIITENRSISTREQATEILQLAKANGWKRLMLSAPLYHQPRIYATFIKAIKELRYPMLIINQPVVGLPWFEKISQGNRLKLLKIELAKINKYEKKGHVATFKEILQYQKWKEKNLKL